MNIPGITDAPESAINIIRQGKFRTIVEIGVYRSSFCKQVLSQVGDNLDCYWLVDPWNADNCTDSSGGNFTQSQWEDEYINACRMMFAYSCVKVLRMTSVKAARLFDHKSVDLVYIDGSHIPTDVVEDINTWKPKIRNGGIISGHDYGAGWPGVKMAVESCFNINEIRLHLGTVWAVTIN